MKKVEELSMDQIESYLARVGRVKQFIGRGYRLFWPFGTWSPFSPVRLFLNLSILVSWGILLYWLALRPSSEMELLVQLGWMWAVVLGVTLILGLVERHFRIKSRFRALTRDERASVFHPPAKGVDPLYHYGREFFRRILK